MTDAVERLAKEMMHDFGFTEAEAAFFAALELGLIEGDVIFEDESDMPLGAAAASTPQRGRRYRATAGRLGDY